MPSGKTISIASSFISLYLLLTLSIGNQVSGTPNGAPPEACSSMTPEHGLPPQSSPSPYVTIPTVKA